MNMLRDKKTYMVAGCMVVVAGLHALGYINDELYGMAMACLNGAGIAALRHGVKKVQTVQEEQAP